MVLKIRELTGGYSGSNVLKDLSLTVNNNEIVALIGLNGSGKSTTINHIIGELQGYAGNIYLNDLDIQKNAMAFKKKIAYIPEQPIIYEELTLEEHIRFILASHDISYEKKKEDIKKLLKEFSLENKTHWYPKYFSKGMKQKVMIVCALLLDADLLIVDEPFIGLDTVSQKKLIAELAVKKALGASVLLTTHSLALASKFVDKFAVLQNGSISDLLTPMDLANKYHLTLDNLDEFFDKEFS